MGGVGPLSLLSILEYAIVYEITGELLDDFLWFLQHLDAAYLKWVGAKNGSGLSPVQQKNNLSS